MNKEQAPSIQPCMTQEFLAALVCYQPGRMNCILVLPLLQIAIIPKHTTDRTWTFSPLTFHFPLLSTHFFQTSLFTYPFSSHISSDGAHRCCLIHLKTFVFKCSVLNHDIKSVGPTQLLVSSAAHGVEK